MRKKFFENSEIRERSALHFLKKSGLPKVSRRFNTVGVTDDNELGMDNPCEAMHHFMARTSRPGALDKNAKPNKQTKDKLDAILQVKPFFSTMETLN